MFFTLCNIHSWIVDKDHRSNSFFLLSTILSNRINFTAFTPVKSLVGLLLKFDFNRHVFYYRTILNFKYFNLLSNNFIISLDFDLMKKKLNQNDLKKLNNYNKSIYIKFVIYDKYNSEYIFVISTIVKKKGFNVLNIFYISNEELFKNNWNSIKPIISRKFNVCFFSEYTFDKKKSFFPENQLFNKISEKKFFLRGKIKLNPEDLLASDLIV